MLKYVLQRLAFLVPVVLGMSLLVFVVFSLVPGDPARAVAGLDASPQQVESIRAEYGFDRPMLEQYVIYVSRLVRGDWGTSLLTRLPVVGDLAAHFPATLELSLASLLIATVLGIPLGILAALFHNRLVDHMARFIALVGVATPVFWLALFLQLLFYRYLNWLPAQGRLGLLDLPPAHLTGLYVLDSALAGQWGVFKSSLAHLVLPAVALSQMSMAIIMRIVRASVLETMHEDFVRTARARGLSEWRILIRHILRNASLPLLTVLGLQFGTLLGGAVLTEAIFSWPGLGSYAVRAVTGLDLPAIMGVAILMSVVYLLVNLLVDLGFVLIDPRLRT